MPRSLKRKPSPPSTPSSFKAPNRTGGAAVDESNPYPGFPNPTLEECQAVRDDLLGLHGFPKDFLKYRKQRLLLNQNLPDLNQSLSNSEQLNEEEGGDDDGCGQESVLDGLVGAILSQNTTEVHAAEPKLVENAIKCAGLAPSKTSCVKGILSCLLEKKGKLCLEYLRDLSIEEIKRDLSCYSGVGPKTVACVLMFHLNQDDFPVDTHVFQIARTIGWVPAEANVKKTYLHLNQRIPNELKFDLNCLLYTHGKACRECSGKGSYKAEVDSNQQPCPLLKYVSSSK
ncbi:PREDICTED: putative DNA glycosylase At3g47830 isoform X2 [Ipomoea nil]|uniref:putative DNA glycosylase At3g47830 isoform X2 n=1 Tax=Ipomoea nil TaxID=35883 RepID=UPI0009015EA2|nr:PREDICTED: putative DNA glycosylase At3g47830 isoform X2 [Ipomoea nil]